MLLLLYCRISHRKKDVDDSDNEVLTYFEDAESQTYAPDDDDDKAEEALDAWIDDLF